MSEALRCFPLMNVRFLRPWLEKTPINNNSITMFFHRNNMHDPPSLWTDSLSPHYEQMPQSQYSQHFPSHSWTCTEWQIFESLMCTLHAEVENGNILPLLQLAAINKCALLGLFTALFFSFFVLFLFTMAPKGSANVLWSGYVHKKAELCLMEKM